MSDEQEARMLRAEASLIYLQSRLEVLEGTVSSLHRNDRIGDMTVVDFVRVQTEARLHRNLAYLADFDPVLATEFAKILADAKREQ